MRKDCNTKRVGKKKCEMFFEYRKRANKGNWGKNIKRKTVNLCGH